MNELYIENKKFIEEKNWFEIIKLLKEKTITINDLEEAKKIVKTEFVKAMEKRLPREKFGIFFSGGVDSSIISLVARKKRAKEDFECYCVGFKTGGMDVPPDILYAERVAKSLDVKLVKKIFDIEEAEEIIEETVKKMPKPRKVNADYVVKVGVGAVIIAAQKISNGAKIFFSGLGSEELFAGYERHTKVDNVNEECWNGLSAMWYRDLFRDVNIAQELGITIATPFLDEELIINSMGINQKLKINDEHKKIIIRYVAEELGLEKEFAWRKKMGAQYGSRFDRAIAKLTKKYKFGKKHEYLESLVKKIKN